MSRMLEVLDLLEPVLDRLYKYVQERLDTETLEPDDRRLEILMNQFSTLNLEFAELTLSLDDAFNMREELARYETITLKFESMTRDVRAYIGE